MRESLWSSHPPKRNYTMFLHFYTLTTYHHDWFCCPDYSLSALFIIIWHHPRWSGFLCQSESKVWRLCSSDIYSHSLSWVSSEEKALFQKREETLYQDLRCIEESYHLYLLTGQAPYSLWSEDPTIWCTRSTRLRSWFRFFSYLYGAVWGVDKGSAHGSTYYGIYSTRKLWL